MAIGQLVISDDVPRWARRWIKACKDLILPTWDVNVAIGECGEDEKMSWLAHVDYSLDYFTANIVLDKNGLENTSECHEAIVHEFVHPLMSEYCGLLDHVFDMGHVNMSQIQYNTNKSLYMDLAKRADERTTTMVGRIIYQLLAKQLN